MPWDAGSCEGAKPKLALALVISRRSVRGRKNNRKKISDGGAVHGPPKVRLALAFLTGGARCLRWLRLNAWKREGEAEESRGGRACERASEHAVCMRETAALNCTESTGRSADRYAWDDIVRAFSRRGAGIRRGPLRKMQRANERETPRRRRRRVLRNGGRRPGSAE